MIPESDLAPLWQDLGTEVQVNGAKVRVIDMKGQNPDPFFDGLSGLAMQPRQLASFGEAIDHYLMVLPSDVKRFNELTTVKIAGKSYRTHPPVTNAVGVGFVSLGEY